MSNITSIFKNKPNPNEYIPCGVVLLAMDYYGIDDPQVAFDRLVQDVCREAFKGDEEINHRPAIKEIAGWAKLAK